MQQLKANLGETFIDLPKLLKFFSVVRLIIMLKY